MIMLKSTHDDEVRALKNVIHELMYYYEHRAGTNGSALFLTQLLGSVGMRRTK